MPNDNIQSREEATVPGAAEQPPKTASVVLDLVERRRVPRALPRPDAVELDQDTGWDLWQQTLKMSHAAAA